MLGIVLAAFTLTAAPSTTDWWRDDVFYEIYPRSFADSNGDGVGDLRGITKHLDDLKALGVDDLWLTPIHPSPSEHGYDVTDYEDVAPDLGGLPAFDELVREAHARHMHIVLDFVLNHTSIKHPWFTAHPEYYVWRDQPDDRYRRPWDNGSVWHKPPSAPSPSSPMPAPDRVYLALFWSGMPDLNLANDDVVKAMEHAMLFWRARGVDGFRIDAARHLVEGTDGAMADTAATHALLARIRRDIAGASLSSSARPPNGAPPSSSAGPPLFIGEVWADDAVIASYRNDLDLAFEFNIAGAIANALADNSRGPLVEELQSAEARFPPSSSSSPSSSSATASSIDGAFLAPFLRNHDMTRLARALAGDDAAAIGARPPAPAVLDAKLRLAAATLVAMPGTPFLYYGEEVGMPGAEPRHAHDDASQRTKLDWHAVAAARADAGSLWHAYADLLALRHAHAALGRGTATRAHVDGGGRGAFAMIRAEATGAGGERMLFVANFADAPATFAVDDDAVDGALGNAGVLESKAPRGSTTAPGRTTPLDGEAALGSTPNTALASKNANAGVVDGKVHVTLPAFGYAFVLLGGASATSPPAAPPVLRGP